MNIADLEFLRCPDCLSELITEKENKIHENKYSGILKCSNCGQIYVQRNNIPHLVVEEKISERDLKFSKQADEYSSYYELAVKIMGLFLLAFTKKKIYQKLENKKRFSKHSRYLYRTWKQFKVPKKVCRANRKTCCNGSIRKND